MFARLLMFSFIVFFAHNALADIEAMPRERHHEESPHSSRL
jgi:hypothetical protein